MYSHGTTPLLISQLEDCLKGKEMLCKLRVNREEKKGKLQLWPYSLANNYLSRSKFLENYSESEMAMDFKKKYNTYKEVHEMLAAAKQGKMHAYKMLDINDNDLQNNITSWKSIQDISMHT